MPGLRRILEAYGDVLISRLLSFTPELAIFFDELGGRRIYTPHGGSLTAQIIFSRARRRQQVYWRLENRGHGKMPTPAADAICEIGIIFVSSNCIYRRRQHVIINLGEMLTGASC